MSNDEANDTSVQVGVNLMNIDLLAVDHKSIPKFPFNDRYEAKITSVYDGDTSWIMFVHDNTIFRFMLRIEGVDTPELKGKYSNEYKDWAIKAKNYVMSLVTDDRLFTVLLSNYDKYGQRIIGDILFDDGEKLSEKLIKHNFAVKYDGGTKMTEAQWLEKINKM